MESIRPYIPFVVPILLLQIGLMLFALFDLLKHPNTRGPRWLWALIIIFINIIGPVVYFLLGREEA